VNKLLAIVIVAASLCILVASLALLHVPRVPPPGPSPIASFSIATSLRNGSTVVPLGRISLPSGSTIVVRVSSVRILGNSSSFSVSGALILRGSGGSYRIEIPCMAFRGCRCVRNASPIAGFEQPMSISGGSYAASLELSVSRCSGSSFAVIDIEISRASSVRAPALEVAGSAPLDPSDLEVARGSSPSASLSLSRVSSVGSSCIAYAWIRGSEPVATVRVFKLPSFELAKAASVKLVRASGGSYEALLSIYVGSGSYVISVAIGNRSVVASLNCVGQSP